ncbi:MAG: DNA translocase FtsK 4TM domain-containing protein [Bacteroidetes bacterium]|nr:DNA translocase FtsK 4TM domain-containing protein [Bacteroidota bacterium]MBL6942998.1 DNA translocase FtsK 4TM domain-containing protein [Bacteroidales bacterium]
MNLKSNKLKPKEVDTPLKQSGKKTKTTRNKSANNSKSGLGFSDPRLLRSVGFLLLITGIYLLLAITTFIFNWFVADSGDIIKTTAEQFKDHTETVTNWTGWLGSFLARILVHRGIGIGAYFIAIFSMSLGLRLLINVRMFSLWRWFELLIISFLWIPVTFNIVFSTHPENLLGGLVGHQLNIWLLAYLGKAGLILLIIFIPVIFSFIDFKFQFKWLERNKNRGNTKSNATSGSTDPPKEDIYNTVEFAVDEDEKDDFNSMFNKPEPGKGNTFKVEVDKSVQRESDDKVLDNMNDVGDEDVELTIEPTKGDENGRTIPVPGEHFGIDTEFDPTLELADYKLPTFDLMKDYDVSNVLVTKEELEINKNRIVETLKHYAISITKIKATIGPTVTLYEVVPAPGIRISKIKSLEDDIALSLSAIGIRIIAPIPGKGTVGIEVPNQNPNIVSMKSILTSEKFRNNNFDLPFGIGKTISNESFVVDLAKMPHLLMAGATGQGKSVGLNAIITSLLYKKHPAELKFILVDPKKVELNLFSRIERHYLAKLPDSEEAIITDTRKVVRTLNSLSIEMDNRYELLKDAQVRNIKEYNKKFIARKLNPLHGHRYLPYLVLIIDEFADLIMTAGKEIETPVTRLAQLSRAIGIHLIIATQRPSVNIITGTIKANFPARIAFRVITKIDSRTILDTGGADQLVGRGDMLFSTGNEVIRLQCAFIDTPEVEKLTSYIGSQRGYPDALHLPEFKDEQSDFKADYDPLERDELFEDAALIIVQTQQGSTSLLQRKLKLGYNRAGRIIDQLEATGIVGPFEGSKARDVKIGSEMALEQFLKDLNSNNEV